MKKIFLILFCMIFLIGVVSAWEFDNVKSYNTNTKTITVENAFGLGGDIAEIKLNTPIIYRVGQGYQKVAEFDLTLYDDYSTAFKELELYDLKDGNKKIIRDFDYMYKTTETTEVPTFKEQCSIVANGTLCNKVQTGTRNVSRETWKKLEDYNFNDKETLTIGIFTEVKKGDYVEWIPNFFGVRIHEWATWTEDLTTEIQHYYPMNTSSAPSDIVAGDTNFTGLDANEFQGGIVNASYNATADGQTLSYSLDSMAGGINDHFTISFWVNRTGTTSGGKCFSNADGDGANTEGEMEVTCSDANVNFYVHNGVSLIETQTTSITINEWTHIVVRYNGTTVEGIINNVSWGVGHDGVGATLSTEGTELFIWERSDGVGDMASTMLFDEIGMWNRSLSDAEVNDLYNDGAGSTYNPQSSGIALSVTSTLLNPADLIETINNSLEFQGTNSVTSGSGNLTNTTLYVWTSNGTEFRTNFTEITGVNNGTNRTLTFSKVENNYTWNYETCGQNSSTTSCVFATNNRTFNITNFEIDSETFNLATTTGATEFFQINISVFSGLQVSTASLIHNNTDFGGTIINPSTDTFSISRELEVPSATTNTNYTFFWNISTDDGTNKNSTSRGQFATVLTFDDCSTNGFVLYNFTVVDEITQTKLNPTNLNVTGKVDVDMFALDNTTAVQNLSILFNEINSFSICLNEDLSGIEYNIDVQVQYDATNYSAEFYNIQKSNIDNSSLWTNITLYDLDDTNAQVFEITYKDENFLAVADALIQIQRKYIDEGRFKTVEIPITDAQGETIAHLQVQDVIYTFNILKNGVLLATFENIVAECDNAVLEDCEINLNSFSSHIDPSDFTTLEDLSFTFAVNKTARTIEVVYSIPSSTSATMKLNSTLVDSIENTEVCSDILTSSAGTLTCNVPLSYGNASFVTRLTRNDNLIGQTIVSIQKDPVDIYGTSLVFLNIFLFLTLIGIAMTDEPLILGFFIVLGVIIAMALNLMDFTGWIGAGATVLWLIIGMVLIAIKRSNRQ